MGGRKKILVKCVGWCNINAHLVHDCATIKARRVQVDDRDASGWFIVQQRMLNRVGASVLGAGLLVGG